ncbi:hypothetical protein RD792_013301 [Penstemon davidsonii]|uniref:Uncharacterized protein n=1 Tax=Penstemon davidsonii TaxID=160366 RepID=A0ABR0CT39_9LAMI|nr:hypothetical protein RD792_013301 [Penstemon davidsonii]
MDHKQYAAGEPPLPPHVLIFPLPLQGHVNSMLKLAELLCVSHLHVTVLLSEYNHSRLRRHADLESRFSRYSGFRVATIPDGLPDDHPRNGERAIEIVLSLKKIGGFEFRKLMESTDALSDGGCRRRVSCLIMDGVLSFAIPVVEEMGIPFIYFRTASACSFWANFCFKEVMEAGELPLKGKDEDKYAYWKKEELDLIVTSVPGMEGFLRRRDLPSYVRVDNADDPGFQTILTETRRTAASSGLILNTFEDLEGPIMDQIRKHIPKVYSIGPLHTHLKYRLDSEKVESTQNSSSFWEEDRSCLTWLDSQPANSVLYVSFGSVTILSNNELLEFWYGLVNSGQKFLWVMRPGGSGWNSTLESIAAGMPMLCWPYFADQTINSRFVSDYWKVGLDIKDTCDRVVIEKKVRGIMQERRDEFLERARSMAELAKKAISEGGTSSSNLNRLIEFIKASI